MKLARSNDSATSGQRSPQEFLNVWRALRDESPLEIEAGVNLPASGQFFRRELILLAGIDRRLGLQVTEQLLEVLAVTQRIEVGIRCDVSGILPASFYSLL